MGTIALDLTLKKDNKERQIRHFWWHEINNQISTDWNFQSHSSADSKKEKHIVWVTKRHITERNTLTFLFSNKIGQIYPPGKQGKKRMCASWVFLHPA